MSPKNLSIFFIFILFCAQSAKAEFGPSGGFFKGDLVLKDVANDYIDHGEFDPGHTEFQLKEDYSYVDSKGDTWTAPQGAVVNGASIPKVVWSWFGGPWSGRYRNAAVIHDWMCGEQLSDSGTVHRVFYEALLNSGVSETVAWVMYQAVVQGGPQWDAGQFGPENLRRPGLTQLEFEKILEEAEALALEE